MYIISFIDQPKFTGLGGYEWQRMYVLPCEQPGSPLMFWCGPICSYFRFSAMFFCCCWSCSVSRVQCPFLIFSYVYLYFESKCVFFKFSSGLSLFRVQPSLRNICRSYRKTHNWYTETSSSAVLVRFVMLDLYFSVLVFCRSLFIICPLSFVYCIVSCPS